MNAFGLGGLARHDAVLDIEGIGRLTHPRRAGAYVVHRLEDEGLEAVQFAPVGMSRDLAPALFDEGVAAFLELGERQKALGLPSAPRVRAVVRVAQGAFWLQDPVGLTLDAWLLDHPEPSTAVIEAFAKALAAALADFHAHGLIHGDLSPGTIAIDDGAVRLALPAIDRRGFFRVLRSQSDLVASGYAPPEAHDGGRRQPIGAAADFYAASAVLRRLVTGVAPDPATAIARLAGGGVDEGLAGSRLRTGIEAGMALAAPDRPSDAAAWLGGLGLSAEAVGDAWFAGAERPLPGPIVIEPEPEPEAPAEPDFTLARPPVGALESPAEEALGPIAEARGDGARKARGGGGASTLLIACAIITAAVAGGAAVWLRPAPKARISAAAVAPAVVPPPMAPGGCQWAPITGGAGWRLACADEPGLVALPERFDTQTTTLASRGDVTAMERLGAFYRQRARRPGLPNRIAYGDEAYVWLARAADSNATGNSEDDRARDDAALALGEMFGGGEGGRAIDPAAAEARLRQAAAGSRADAVLALAQRLWTEAQQDPAAGADKLAEARRLFSRVARLPEESPLRLTARQSLGEIDNARAAAAAKVEAERAEAARIAEAARAAEAARLAKAAKPAAKAPVRPIATAQSATVDAMKKTARAVLGEARNRLAAATDAAIKATAAPRQPPKPAAKPAPRRVEAPRPPPAPPVRNWTARTSVQIDDPTADFTFQVQEAGHALCEAEGGYASSVRENEVICPNGVLYCQVRISAVCRGL